MDRASPTDPVLVKREQDAELDRKIEALRKKNEALMKRYQEVEEDKKRAEQEGMALFRKGKVEDLTITINKSSTEKRVVTKKGSGGPKRVQEQEQGGTGSAIFSAGRGKRRQLLVTTPGSIKGKRVVSEKVDRSGPIGHSATILPTEDKESPGETTVGERHSLHTKRSTQSQAGRKLERKCRTEEASHGLVECEPCPLSTDSPDAVDYANVDVDISNEGRQEYLRWKKEREEIDRERVARHRNSQGQWRRAWDMDKPELMLSEKVQGAAERGTQNRGHPVRQHDKRGKNVPVVGSKAKGKDRLTGRARRWEAKTEEEQLLACSETSLEEFLEELDAFCDPEADSSTADTDIREVEPRASEMVGTNSIDSTDLKAEPENISTMSANSETFSSRGGEKKVRFLEDVIQVAYEKSYNTDTTETNASSLRNTSQAKSAHAEGDTQQASEYNHESIKYTKEQEVIGTLHTTVQAKAPGQEDAQDISVKELSQPPKGFQKEGTGNSPKESPCYTLSSQNGSPAPASTEQELLHPLKTNTSRSTEELIDSSLSVLNLEPGEPLPDHNTSTDKARENGKIV
ncbi:uncharacterized protein ccdc9b isoform X2 [Brachyhypopomus gauderio]|uniref:uncharacterized protein ccdc9b isoform X2 n=1 Tax=Brachyhypopomus gauderio TaxID=698409 RepID=UPI0040423A3F